MTHRTPVPLLLLTAALTFTGCRQAPSPTPSVAVETPKFVGAWRARVTLTSGPLAEMTYASTISLSLFDRANAPIAGSGLGAGTGARIGF